MARIRTIKPEFFVDDDLGDLPIETRYVFIGLFCQADRDGKMDDKPRILKVQIAPYDNIDIGAALDDLSGENGHKPFIRRYVGGDGRKYIQIINWHRHQRPHHTERQSPRPGATEEAPPWLDLWPADWQEDAAFCGAWENWCAHRREIRKPLTERGVKIAVKDFAGGGVKPCVAAINNSIKNGYQGLFAAKGKGARSAKERFTDD